MQSRDSGFLHFAIHGNGTKLHPLWCTLLILAFALFIASFILFDIEIGLEGSAALLSGKGFNWSMLR